MASLGPKEIYLILYNSVCCYGWALVLLGAIKTLIGGDGSLGENLSNVYAPVADMLTYAQTAALMEIVHAGVGLVRSPVVVTAMQVSSRIFALVAIVYAPSAQGELCYVVVLGDIRQARESTNLPTTNIQFNGALD
jgi:very-long-chain (3R)-3-hydroxyacyl-CoA dehydratase